MFPYYISIGMTDEQYWERDPYLIQTYRKAHELRIEQRNQEMYVQGLYNYDAFRAVIEAFSWGLGGRKGSRPAPYREHPISLTAHEKEAERQRNIAKTLAWVKNGQGEGGA